jgi:hypothetical protein
LSAVATFKVFQPVYPKKLDLKNLSLYGLGFNTLVVSLYAEAAALAGRFFIRLCIDLPKNLSRMVFLRELRAVISSPDDVKDERQTLADLIEKLNKNFAGLGVTLSVRRWEDAPPGFWEQGVQHHLDSFLKIEDSDIFIGILWKKFGTPGRDGKTGIEHEFNKAYEAWEKNKRPKIVLYFNQQEYSLTTPEEALQLAAVLDFKQKIRRKGEGLYIQYTGLEDFENKVERDLVAFILKCTHKSNFDVDEIKKKIHEPDNRAIEHYLDNHSKEVAKIISENWTKKSGLFASCKYENGVKHMNQPSEPDVTKSGLAKQHLMSGYHDAWEFYNVGRDESVQKCEEICGIINAYEGTIFTEIEREIRTSSGNQKLERKKRGEVFIGQHYPDKFDRFVKSLYLYPDILYAIFTHIVGTMELQDRM